ncbi:MAG: hypothetical protein HKM93_19690 [Desulfobacteraceae bacterium]|nr:hypothetical protein [Desulfobacteraceae bacterium]
MKFGVSLLFFIALFSHSVHCDTIYLKDGTSEKSDKIWEEGGYIHFILMGTTSVEIRYAREIVDKIITDEGVILPIILDSRAFQHTGDNPAENAGITGNSHAVTAPPATVSPGTADSPDMNRLVAEHQRIQFYDPRRPLKYWTTKTSRHKTYGEAVSSLARIYSRSDSWVRQNMGETNDLGAIHNHLYRQYLQSADENVNDRVINGTDPVQTTDSPPLSGSVPAPADEDLSIDTAKQYHEGSDSFRGIQFYNPRRLQKYWTSRTSKFNSLQSAINDLAAQYGKTSAWVEAHMGETNDLAEIHSNLRKKDP